MEKLEKQVAVRKENVPALIGELERRPTAKPLEKPDLQNRLEKLGFKTAVDTMDRIKRMSIAYENFLFLMPEKVNAFNTRLKKETSKETGLGWNKTIEYQQLVFTPIEDYEKVPPDHVLESLEKAQNLNIFDRFEVAHIKAVKEIPDPIVFGRIDGCIDRFYIAQWDDDVRIEDLLLENV